MSFRIKTILGIAIIEGLLLLLLVVMGLDRMFESYQHELIKRASTTATLFATTSKDAVLSSDLASLESFAKEVMNNPGLVYARVLDHNGITLAQHGDKKQLALPFIEDHIVEKVKNTDAIFDTHAEIREAGKLYGQVQIGLDITELYENLNDAKTNATWLALLEMMLVALFSFVLGTWLTHQLKALESGAQKIKEGDFGYQIPVNSHDEIARTAIAFNKMSLQLKTLYGEVLHVNEALEERIAERTTELRKINAQLIQEMNERQQVEQELRLAHKLESVGQLAAGIAHEINTPMQFIGDNVYFLKDSFHDLQTLINHYEVILQTLNKEKLITNDILINLQETKEDTDLDYLKEHVPNAFSRALDGIDRVCSIVSAMKAFSHPQDERSPIDINKAITTTLSVARNEYKYHANVTTNFAEIPLVMAFGGDINQVFLNLIVNAAHAIESVTQANDKLGQITIKTSQKNNTIVISISDTGCGIPEPIQHRIFDPFFTTKEVGRGTGQGLSLIHTIIVDKHGGNIRFDTKINQGTTFYITLPINAESTLKIRRKT